MMYSTLKPVFRVCKNGKRCVMHYGSRPWLHSLSVYQSNCELVYKNKGSPTKGCGAAKQARVARLQLGSSSSAQPAKLQPGRAQLHMCTGAQMHRCIHAITPL
jgi:hypothetical protein